MRIVLVNVEPVIKRYVEIIQAKKVSNPINIPIKGMILFMKDFLFPSIE